MTDLSFCTFQKCPCKADLVNSPIYSNLKSNDGPEIMSVCLFTCGGPYSSYEDRRDSHDQAAEGGDEGKDLGIGS